MVKPLGLMKSGESWKPMIRQRVCNKGGKLGEEQGLPVWSPLGVPQSSQIRCSFLTHTGRASLPWECSDPLQGRWGRSESPSSSCCFCDLLPGRGFMTTEFFGEALLLGSWWFQELKCLQLRKILLRSLLGVASSNPFHFKKISFPIFTELIFAPFCISLPISFNIKLLKNNKKNLHMNFDSHSQCWICWKERTLGG